MTLDPKKVFFVPYRTGSESIDLLTQRLGIKSTKIDGTSKALAKPKDKVFIFWGKPPFKVSPEVRDYAICLNHPQYTKFAVDKLAFFNRIQDRSYCLEFTTDEDVARDWIEEDEAKVIARETLTGMGGEGITVIRSIDEWPTNKSFVLYTKYVPKKAEYRVHVVRSEVIAVSRKVMPTGGIPHAESLGWEVRSHDNGFIFQREDLDNVPAEVKSAAVDSVNSCGLDFAGVDVLWNQKRAKAYVCEINSAPGIEGGTVEAYAEALESYINDLIADRATW
jgi:glutathione synthase/RimK-type ligase-like ATP-grasp enzyme